MASIDSLQSLLVDELRDIYDAEKRLTKALPKMVKASTHDELSSALESHLNETQEHVSRLEQAFEMLDEPAKAKTCPGMKGLIEEGDEHIGEDYEDDSLRDAVIIGSAQRVEHYEIAAYGTAIAHARLLELNDVVNLLEQTLEEEKAADQKLTEIAEGIVNVDAGQGGEEEEEEAPAPSRGRGASRTMSATGARSSGQRSQAADRGKSSSSSSSKRGRR